MQTYQIDINRGQYKTEVEADSLLEAKTIAGVVSTIHDFCQPWIVIKKEGNEILGWQKEE